MYCEEVNIMSEVKAEASAVKGERESTRVAKPAKKIVKVRNENL